MTKSGLFIETDICETWCIVTTTYPNKNHIIYLI